MLITQHKIKFLHEILIVFRHKGACRLARKDKYIGRCEDFPNVIADLISKLILAFPSPKSLVGSGKVGHRDSSQKKALLDVSTQKKMIF